MNDDARQNAGTHQPRSWPYPGGKSKLAPWVIEQIPDHDCYVEPFAGSAAVLVNKPRSRIEAMNDVDGMVVKAYRTITSRLPELVERLDEIPYSEELHLQWMGHLDSGEWPEDDIESVARWLYLRYSQHSAKLSARSGFKHAKATNPALAWRNAKQALPALADRLDTVQIHNSDWEAVADDYDGEDTVAYFDPPYEGKGDELYRHEGKFDHERLATWLAQSECRWIVSYDDIPDPISELEATIINRETTYHGSSRDGSSCKTATERLICNFDPSSTTTFVDASQSTLTEVGGSV